MNLRDELMTIYRQEGRLNPRVVVEAARSANHPLHSAVFDCPTKMAAERYYLGRAHELIQSVKVTYREPTTSKPYEIRAFHALPSEDSREHTYKPTDEVVNDPVLKALVLREMERDWRQLQARYSAFVEFLDLVSADLAKVS